MSSSMETTLNGSYHRKDSLDSSFLNYDYKSINAPDCIDPLHSSLRSNATNRFQQLDRSTGQAKLNRIQNVGSGGSAPVDSTVSEQVTSNERCQ